MDIVGYFSGIKDANRALGELRKAGFSNASVDLNDHYIGNKNVERNIIGTENAQILSDLVINSGSPDSNIGEGPLLAASPMASGYGRTEEIADINYSLLVECSNDRAEEAREIIRQMGGMLDNPNVSRYETAMKNDIDFDKAEKIISGDVNIRDINI